MKIDKNNAAACGLVENVCLSLLPSLASALLLVVVSSTMSSTAGVSTKVSFSSVSLSSIMYSDDSEGADFCKINNEEGAL